MHLGDVRIDKEKQDALREFLLEYVKSNADELIVLGDCFELAQYTVQEVWANANDSIRTLVELASSMRVTFVVGNHDLFLKEFIGDYQMLNMLYPSYTFEQSGKRFYLEHGHRYQAEYRSNPAMYNALATAGRLLDYLPPEVEDVGGSLFLKLKQLKHWEVFTSEKTGESLEEDLNDFQIAAKEFMEKGYDRVLFGHTHRPLIKGLAGGTYVNTGDWVIHQTYTVIKEGIPALYEWRGTKGVGTRWRNVS